MRVAFATAEMVPFAKTGGLGDVIGSLPSKISQQGHVVKVFLPFYQLIRDKNLSLKVRLDDLAISLGETQYRGRILGCEMEDGVEVLFVDFPDFFDRPDIYGDALGDYSDNDQRFIVFQKSCLEASKQLDFCPDIFHCHDWHTGLIPAYLKLVYRTDSFYQDTKSVFTIHNLAYQGSFSAESLAWTDFDKSDFKADKLAFHKSLNFMKAGIVYADHITTVSQRYSEEICTKKYGCGLEKVLKSRAGHLSGIINGIDPADWMPETDRELNIPFKPNEWNKKIANKGILQKENKLTVHPDIPVFGIVSRIAEQKGFDILIEALGKMSRLNMQLIILGTGEERYHKLLEKAEKKYRDKVSVNILFDLTMAKRIYAGADVFLIPSQYEPCGLGQLIALRYGTVPLVRETGGLADTIQNFDPKAGTGNGITFKDYTASSLLDAVKRTVKLFKDKKSWQRMVENGMQDDFSWEASAKKYVELYRQVEKQALAVT